MVRISYSGGSLRYNADVIVPARRPSVRALPRPVIVLLVVENSPPAESVTKRKETIQLGFVRAIFLFSGFCSF
jgi:hypothetical protein